MLYRKKGLLFQYFQTQKQESSKKTSILLYRLCQSLLTVWITTNWKILKEMEIPDHLNCFLRNLYVGQEATVRTGLGTLDWASLVTQTVKHLPAMQETQVRSLGQKDPLEKEMATHSSTLAWKIPWTVEPGRLQFMGLQRAGHN